MDKPFSLVPSGSGVQTNVDQQLEFRAMSVVVHNPTNQWIYLGGVGVYVPQMTAGAIYPAGGTFRAQASFAAPAGIGNPPAISGQAAVVTFYDLVFAPSSGVGMLGGRAPYYDRNPLPIALSYVASSVAPHAAVTRITYTVPANRAAYVEKILAALLRDSASAPAGLATAYAQYTPSGGAIKTIAAALDFSTALNSKDRDSTPQTALIKAGDVLAMTTQDASTGGSYTYAVAIKAIEFDV